MKSRPRLRVLGAAAALAALAVDQGSKQVALSAEALVAGRIELLSFLDLVLVRNRGISFGLLGGGFAPWWLLALVAVAIAVLLVWWLWRADDAASAAALGFIIGGALGNVFDRARYGAVTDFVDLHAGGWHWPAFNFADAFITIGVALLLIAPPRRPASIRRDRA